MGEGLDDVELEPCGGWTHSTHTTQKGETFWKVVALRKAGFRKKSSRGNLFLLALLGQENSLDVGEHTTLSDGDTREKLVQLFIIPDGQLEMSGVDSLLLVVPGGVASQLEDLGGQVLHDCGQVDGGTSAYTLRVVALAEKTVDTSNGELEPSAGRSCLGLSAGLASFSTSRHDEIVFFAVLYTR